MADKLPDVHPAGEEPKKHGDKLEQEVRQQQDKLKGENPVSEQFTQSGKRRATQDPIRANQEDA